MSAISCCLRADVDVVNSLEHKTQPKMSTASTHNGQHVELRTQTKTQKKVQRAAANRSRLDAAEAFVDDVISSATLVLFTKSWCTACRKLREMLEDNYDLKRHEDYRALELDVGEFDHVAILECLAARAGVTKASVPIGFLSGVYIDAETWHLWHASGELRTRLTALGIRALSDGGDAGDSGTQNGPSGSDVNQRLSVADLTTAAGGHRRSSAENPPTTVEEI